MKFYNYPNFRSSYWIRHFEFFNFVFKFVLSDPKDSLKPTFIIINQVLKFLKTSAIILDSLC